jgi:hypothetical protein
VPGVDGAVRVIVHWPSDRVVEDELVLQAVSVTVLPTRVRGIPLVVPVSLTKNVTRAPLCGEVGVGVTVR